MPDTALFFKSLFELCGKSSFPKDTKIKNEKHYRNIRSCKWSSRVLYGEFRANEIRTFCWNSQPRLPLFFRRNSRVISGPAISPPRLLSFDYKFRNEISYSLRDPFIRHSNGVFLRSRVVPARKHVNTYGAPHTQTISFDDVHQPFLILHAPPAVENGAVLLSSADSRTEDTRFYDVQLYERLSEIFHPPHRARRSAFYPPPRRGSLLEATRSPAWQWKLASFYATLERRGTIPSDTMPSFVMRDLKSTVALVLDH